MQKKIKIKRVGEVSDYIERLYVESFPADERRPPDEWRRLIGEGRTQLYEVMADGETVGFITVWDLGDIAYGEHFAIDPSLRGAGIGGKVFDEVVAAVTAVVKPMLLEVEMPESSREAERRIGFYERHGFHVLKGYDYVQPAYSAELSPLPMLLMSDREVDPAHAAAKLRREVYGCKEGSDK